MARPKIDKIQQLTTELINELKQSPNIYDESIIYSKLGKAVLLGFDGIKPKKSTKAVKVKQINSLGKVVRIHDSLFEAQRKTGIPASSISRVINNPNRHIAGSFYWEKA